MIVSRSISVQFLLVFLVAINGWLHCFSPALG